MNSDGLAKHYALLTPWERLPLILAASARGDQQERSRLATSAPRLAYQLQDSFGLADGLHDAAMLQQMQGIGRAATKAVTQLSQPEAGTRKKQLHGSLSAWRPLAVARGGSFSPGKDQKGLEKRGGPPRDGAMRCRPETPGLRVGNPATASLPSP